MGTRVTPLGTLKQIRRYPVKGVAGESLHRARVRRGGGLLFDRALALSNGSRVTPNPTGWTSSAAFHRLLVEPGLALFRAKLSDPPPAVLLTAPNGESLRVRLTDEATNTADLADANHHLQHWFADGSHGPPQLIRPGVGLWDHPDAEISIINLDTLDALETAAGQCIDLRRFRANLYLSGLGAWREFDLVDQPMQIGEVTLQVRRPTDRCRATMANPDTGEADLNIPALLAASFGHMFFGVYARVETPGLLEVGQSVTTPGKRSPVLVDRQPPTAPPRSDWPRRATVTRVVRETETVTSLWLRDPQGVLPGALPGQHLRVHVPELVGTDTPDWRCFTVSATEGDEVRISVRRALAPGVSSWLHQRLVGSNLLVSGPFGNVTLAPGEDAPLLLASAGIGITPTVAMLRAVQARQPSRPVTVLHVARDAHDLALWPEVLATTCRLDTVRTVLYLSRATGQDLPGSARPGRPSDRDIRELAADLLPLSQAYVCGPEPFRRDVTTALKDVGVPPLSIRQEVFFSPTTNGLTQREPPLSGPFQVRFTGGNLTAQWKPDAGSLLDLAEGSGLTPAYGCRAGACRNCMVPLASGTATHLTELALPPEDGSILLCCAVPTSDVVVSA